MMDGLVLRVMSGGGGGVGFALVNELPVNVGACYAMCEYGTLSCQLVSY